MTGGRRGAWGLAPEPHFLLRWRYDHFKGAAAAAAAAGCSFNPARAARGIPAPSVQAGAAQRAARVGLGVSTQVAGSRTRRGPGSAACLSGAWRGAVGLARRGQARQRGSARAYGAAQRPRCAGWAGAEGRAVLRARLAAWYALGPCSRARRCIACCREGLLQSEQGFSSPVHGGMMVPMGRRQRPPRTRRSRRREGRARGSRTGRGAAHGGRAPVRPGS
jgi:hypothetical protein